MTKSILSSLRCLAHEPHGHALPPPYRPVCRGFGVGDGVAVGVATPSDGIAGKTNALTLLPSVTYMAPLAITGTRANLPTSCAHNFFPVNASNAYRVPGSPELYTYVTPPTTRSEPVVRFDHSLSGVDKSSSAISSELRGGTSYRIPPATVCGKIRALLP